MPAVALGRGLDRLPVRDLRFLEVDLDLEALAQLAHGDLDVELPGAGQQHLVGLRVARQAQHRVLLHDPVQGLRDLVLVPARLRLDGEGRGRLGELDGRVDDGVRLVAERVVGLGLLQLRHRAEVAGLDLGHRRLVLALEEEERAHPLREIAVGVVDGAVRLQDTRVDAEEADPSRVRIGQRLEDERGEGRARGRGPGGGFLLQGIDPGGLAAVHRGGQHVHDRVQDRLHGHVPPGGAGQDREDPAREHRLAQAAHEVLLGQRALVEEGLHEVLVALGHHLHQLLAPRPRRLLDLGGEVDGLELPALVALVHVGLLGQEVGHAHEALLLAERDRERDDTAPEGGLERVEGAQERRPLAVHPVDDDQARDPQLRRVAPGALGLDLHPRHAVHDQERGVGHAEAGLGLGEEGRVAGRVHEVDLDLAPFAPRKRGLEADAALDLVGIEVGRGGAVVHPAEPVDRPHVEEHGRDERRLAAASVTDQGHVADARRFVDLHATLRVVRVGKAIISQGL